eukprot:365742-Chlamydomonas_euryale.AAC.14
MRRTSRTRMRHAWRACMGRVCMRGAWSTCMAGPWHATCARPTVGRHHVWVRDGCAAYTPPQQLSF